ncbi:UDP-N-acetylmuramate dehydrogenase [Candidatus Kaiserbacteria bacterium]|nr:UDP-N-acetylmuramate dehydrogenase [Candidatus Kaiserbacteria bacterium]
MLKIRENIPLAEITTFKIGGAARYYVEVKTEDEIRDALNWARGKRLPHVVLAGGSNVLVPDDGLEALVIRVVSARYLFEGTALAADAGCNLLDLIRKASILGLGGWEKLSGIPGSIGGAIRGNAGAFGTEIKDVAFSVDVLDANTMERKQFANEQCAFAYRMSYFKMHPELIITRVSVDLKKVDGQESRTLSEETIQERERRHLQNVQAAGSYFVNPVAPAHVVEMFEAEKDIKSRESRVPAGWLIEKAGMKGATVGGAIASLQHPNYIVNIGNATAKDVKMLAEKVKQAVKIQFRIDLQEEAVVL